MEGGVTKTTPGATGMSHLSHLAEGQRVAVSTQLAELPGDLGRVAPERAVPDLDDRPASSVVHSLPHLLDELVRQRDLELAGRVGDQVQAGRDVAAAVVQRRQADAGLHGPVDVVPVVPARGLAEQVVPAVPQLAAAG